MYTYCGIFHWIKSRKLDLMVVLMVLLIKLMELARGKIFLTKKFLFKARVISFNVEFNSYR